jgi:hypothetical protein
MPFLWWRHRKPVSFSLVTACGGQGGGGGAITKISFVSFTITINMYFMGETNVFKTVVTN